MRHPAAPFRLSQSLVSRLAAATLIIEGAN